MRFFIKSSLSILLFFLISSYGFPIIVDLFLSVLIIYIIKFNFYNLIIINFLLLILTIPLNILLIKGLKEKDIFYRAHEKFIDEKGIYKKNISSEMMMPHGDIVAADHCVKHNNIIEPRIQKFITDKNGFRNDITDIEDAEIILVGDSFIVGSSNTQEDTPANILNKLTKKKVYSITAIGKPHLYNMHIKNHLEELSEESNILLFYFAGNDFNYEFKKNKNFIYSRGKPISYIKYKISDEYEGLERSKDKIFIKFFSYIYEKNYFYKKIRPKSQRLIKKTFSEWTNSCPVEYHKINNINVGFYYKPPKNYINVSTKIITNNKILKKIKKVYFIPTKYNVYSKYINEETINKDDYNYLKINYEKLGIEVVDLTNVLIFSAEEHLKKNQFVYWKDDTHWNKWGIISAMRYISDNL